MKCDNKDCPHERRFAGIKQLEELEEENKRLNRIVVRLDGLIDAYQDDEMFGTGLVKEGVVLGELKLVRGLTKEGRSHE